MSVIGIVLVSWDGTVRRLPWEYDDLCGGGLGPMWIETRDGDVRRAYERASSWAGVYAEHPRDEMKGTLVYLERPVALLDRYRENEIDSFRRQASAVERASVVVLEDGTVYRTLCPVSVLTPKDGPL